MLNLYTALLSLHVLAAVIWVGGNTYNQVLAIRAERSTQPGELVRFLREVEAIGTKMFLPASLVLIATGFGLVAEGDLEFELWIIIGLAVWVASAVTGAGFLGPESGRIGTIVEREGQDSPAAAARIKRIFVVSRIELALLIIVVIDMVIKPGS